MPTYEYVCHHCGHEFELFQQMSAPVRKKCPECARPKLKRLIGAGAGVIFKGSGFYETDYRTESYRKAADAETKAASGSSGDNSKSGSDSKPGASKSKDAASPTGGGASDSKGGKKSGAARKKAGAST
jgi:putative FmdB family regulatory protein